MADPWKSDTSFVAASGDDVVVWVPKSISSALRDSILSLSSRSKSSEQTIGLAQTISEVFLGKWYEIDF